jgi:hypothetical protein
MSRPPRYLELDSIPPCKKYPDKTVKEMCDDREMIQWLTWMQGRDGFMLLNCKLNGGECFEYYVQKMNEYKHMDDIKEFARLVQKMRKAQSAFFEAARKGLKDQKDLALKESKVLEKQVDALCDDIINPINQTQTNLF